MSNYVNLLYLKFYSNDHNKASVSSPSSHNAPEKAPCTYENILRCNVHDSCVRLQMDCS